MTRSREEEVIFFESILIGQSQKMELPGNGITRITDPSMESSGYDTQAVDCYLAPVKYKTGL
jgi:hypothetical protein